MKFLIRADSGAEIGTGHIMRCLTLACRLRREGHQLVFLSKPHAGHINHTVRAQGFPVIDLDINLSANSNSLTHSHWLGGSQSDDAGQSIERMTEHLGGMADWVIVDHYGLDQYWESQFAGKGIKVFVIDDLADRNHDCDLLLDQNLGRLHKDYKDRVPQRCVLKLGVEYALLRDEFMMGRNAIIEHRRDAIHKGRGRVLVMMGGTDHLDYSSKVLEVLGHADRIDKVTVLLGPTAPHYKKIANYCTHRMGYSCIAGASDVAKIMLGHDICIGAAGGSSWERCAVGLPSLVIAFAENQQLIAQSLHKKGAAYCLSVDFTVTSVCEQLRCLQFSDTHYMDSVYHCLDICDGQGINKIMTLFKI